jgi:hypothetical protein
VQFATRRKRSRNIVYGCSSVTPCTFQVIDYRFKAESVTGFFISSFELAHNNCTGSAKLTTRQVSQHSTAQHAVAADPRTPSRSLQKQVKASTVLPVPTRMMYVLEARSWRHQSETMSQHSSLSRRRCSRSASHSCFDCDKNGRYRRAFVSHPFVTRHQQYGQH